jgi:NTE family protein
MFKNILFIAFSFLSIFTDGCNVLSLSGGGSFGINEVAILKNMYDTNQINHNFDIITGISAGGLNSGVLNFYNDTNKGLDELRNIYFSLNNEMVYKHDEFHIFNNWSFFNTEPLKKTIENIMDKYKTDEKITLIGATDINKGKLKIFDFHRLNRKDKIDVLLATSAIPIAFPPVNINGTLYVDGGVLSNEIIPRNNCNVLLITSHPPLEEERNIKDFFKYSERIFEIIYNEFNDETTKTVSKQILHCYPTSKLLNYSMLDFTKAKEIYEITYNNYKCNNLSTKPQIKSNDKSS